MIHSRFCERSMTDKLIVQISQDSSTFSEGLFPKISFGQQLLTCPTSFQKIHPHKSYIFEGGSKN